MVGTVEHNWHEETPDAKARWFQSLSMLERMEVFCSFTDLALTLNPALQDQRHVRSITGRFQVLSKPQS